MIPVQTEEKFGQCVVDVNNLPAKSPLVQALASCHSLTSIQGQLKGDPLDLKMFEFTQWVRYLFANKKNIREDLLPYKR